MRFRYVDDAGRLADHTVRMEDGPLSDAADLMASSQACSKAAIYFADARTIERVGEDGAGDLDAQELVEWDGGEVEIPARSSADPSAFQALMEAWQGIERRLVVTLRVGEERAHVTLEAESAAPFEAIAEAVAALSTAGLDAWEVVEWLEVEDEPDDGPYDAIDGMLVALAYADGTSGRYIVPAPTETLFEKAETVKTGEAAYLSLTSDLLAVARSQRGAVVDSVTKASRTRRRRTE